MSELHKFGIILSAIVPLGCNVSKPDSKSKLSPRQIFDLRTKCQQIVDKDVEDLSIAVVGNALVSDVKSHYNPLTNHCYAEVDVRKTFGYNYPATPNNYYSIGLYDAQTRDLLMTTDQKGEQRSGIDWTVEDHYKQTYDQIQDKIHSLMTQEQ
jgi:hypothetical protein